MLRIAVVALLTTLSIPAVAQDAAKSEKSPAPCQVNQEDYAVFTALLNGLGGPEDPEEAWAGKQIIDVAQSNALGSEDINHGGWGFRSKSKDAPAPETVASLQERGVASCPLEKFPTMQPYEFITRSEIDLLFGNRHKKGKDGWHLFYKQHPQAGGFWSLSLPGYSRDGTEALLSVSHSCGWLCGTGHLYLLRKHSGKWMVSNRLMLWIS